MCGVEGVSIGCLPYMVTVGYYGGLFSLWVGRGIWLVCESLFVIGLCCKFPDCCVILPRLPYMCVVEGLHVEDEFQCWGIQ